MLHILRRDTRRSIGIAAQGLVADEDMRTAGSAAVFVDEILVLWSYQLEGPSGFSRMDLLHFDVSSMPQRQDAVSIWRV